MLVNLRDDYQRAAQRSLRHSLGPGWLQDLHRVSGTVRPLIIIPPLAKKQVSTGALKALGHPSLVQT